jgi:hypothetical protein
MTLSISFIIAQSAARAITAEARNLIAVLRSLQHLDNVAG